jgi:hypothetical protein
MTGSWISMEMVFAASNLLVLPFWLLMIVLPAWRGTRWLMRSPLVLAPLPLLYTALLAPRLGELLPLLLNPRLADIAALLGTEVGALLGWVHFLAFDLFVGRWVYLDCREREISAWTMAPVLFLVLMVGPFGLLSYLGVRAWVNGARGMV